MSTPRSWSDEPIESVQEDSFGRRPFASLLAQTIDRVQLGAASTVFGLLGRWGSGKSSVAAMTGELLPDTWIVQSFTPWAASGAAALQLEFVASLDAALGGGLAEKGAAKTALRKYARWASPVLAALPRSRPNASKYYSSSSRRFLGAPAMVTGVRSPWRAPYEDGKASSNRLRRH